MFLEPFKLPFIGKPNEFFKNGIFSTVSEIALLDKGECIFQKFMTVFELYHSIVCYYLVIGKINEYHASKMAYLCNIVK